MISGDSPKIAKQEEPQPVINLEVHNSPKETVVVPPLTKQPKKSPSVLNQASPSGALQSTPTAAGVAAGGINTAQKKQKGGKKKAQESMSNANGALISSNDKYKNIPGVTEWFQAKKTELDKQTSGGVTSSTPSAPSNQGANSAQARKNAALLGLPLSSHVWRPPRIDQERFQVDGLPVKQPVPQSFMVPQALTISQGDLFNPETAKQQFKDIPKKKQPLCKKRRSRSFDGPSKPSHVLSVSSSSSESDSSSSDEEIKGHAGIRRKIDGVKDVAIGDNQSPLEIKVAAASENKRRCLKSQEKSLFDPKNLESSDQQQKLKEYLELVEFLMSETLSSCNGLWLKGSLTSYSERALRLLASYAYNFDLATFHLLYPSVMSVPARRTELLHSLTECELHAIVRDAVIDLRGCKTQEAEEATAALLGCLYQGGGLTVEDLQHHAQVLKKMRVEMPAEVEREVARSREFSKGVKKRCGGVPGVMGAQNNQMSMDRKMKIDEIIQLQNEAREQYYVITPEMITLNDYVSKAQNWIEKAELISKQVTQLKTLQILLQDARSIPVNFDTLYENLRKRSQEGENIVQKIYNSFTKVTKTRTQLISNDQNNPHHPSVNSDKELQYRMILREADAILITNPEIVRLREHMEQIDQWKSRVCLFLEDTLASQKEHREIFLQLIRETALFKVELELTEDLQLRLEFVEWHDRVEALDRVSREGQPIELGKLEVVVVEGNAKGFVENSGLQEVQRVVALYKVAEGLQKEIKGVIECLEGGKETQELSKLIEITERVQQIGVNIEEVKELSKIIEEAQGHAQISDKYLSNWTFLTEDSDELSEPEDKQKYLQDLIKFRDQIRDLGITCPSFTKLNQNLRPLLIWIENTRKLIKLYSKSLDLQTPFAQLSLMEGKDNSDDGEVIEIPDKDYLLIQYLTSVAQTRFKILLSTKDYSILNDLDVKVTQWIARADSIILEELSNPESLEKLLSECLPVPPEKQQMLSKHLRRVKWLKRLQELRTAEKVKLKSIETLAKEGTQLMVTDERMLEEIAIVNEQLQKCKEWSDEQNKSDMGSIGEIKRLLKLGKESLKFELDDYVDLKNFHHDTCSWRNATKALLTQGHRLPEYTTEFLKKHIDEAKNQLGIDDKETALLSAILDVSIHWKGLAQKFLQSREMAKLDLSNQLLGSGGKINEPRFYVMVQRREVLEVQSSLKSSSSQEADLKTAFALQEVITPFDLPPPKPLKQLKKQFSSNFQSEQEQQELIIQQAIDNKRYCVCRRGDDGLQFMIECDSCKEWFHGHCVGIASEDEAELKEQQNYICIGCARAFFQFDHINNEQKKKATADDSQLQIINPGTLKVFSQSLKKRMSLNFLKKLIEEGLQIPIFMPELLTLRQMHFKSTQIKSRATYLLSYPLYKFKAADEDMSDNEDDMNNPYASDSSSEMIINTKVSQFAPKVGEQDQERAACWGRDRIGSELLQIYLETESFPFEIDPDLTDEMIKMIRVRRWYWESASFIAQVLKNQAHSNNSKAQLKKNLKRMIGSYENFSQGCDSQHLQQFMGYQLQCLKLALEALNTNQPLSLPEMPKPIIEEEEESCQEISSSSDVEMIDQ